MMTETRPHSRAVRWLFVAAVASIAAAARPGLAQTIPDEVVVPSPDPKEIVDDFGRVPDVVTPRRFVAVTHLSDYRLPHYHGTIAQSNSALFLLFAINGTAREAAVTAYALNNGGTAVTESDAVVLPGHTARLFPDPDWTGYVPQAGPRPYQGETIVVVSSEPVIVKGHYREESDDFDFQDTTGDGGSADIATAQGTSHSRTLHFDVFDCGDPADRTRVATWCELPVGSGGG